MVWKTRMFVLMSVLCAFMMAPAASFAGKKSALKELEGKAYYTSVNIWYEDPAEILSTNYHKGTMLPINTQVRIEAVNKRKIVFTDGNNTAYTIQVVSKHTPISFEDLFQHYFSETQVDPMNFSDEECRGIETGTIFAGMSKDAVIAAYGYPPAHVTPSLESDRWKYWQDRFRNFLVFFGPDGRVVRMGTEE